MMMIREAVTKDAVEIAKLSHQLGYTISAGQTLQNIIALSQSESHAVFVAVDEKVIGWIGVCFKISIEQAPVCEINGLVVDENNRSKGVAKLLIEKAKQWSRGKGVDTLRLRCNVKRTESHNFYIHIGFTEIKQQKMFVINI